MLSFSSSSMTEIGTRVKNTAENTVTFMLHGTLCMALQMFVDFTPNCWFEDLRPALRAVDRSAATGASLWCWCDTHRLYGDVRDRL